MRLVVWNCHQAFHKKFDVLLTHLRPDVAVIAECASPDVERIRAVYRSPTVTGYEWVGDKRDRGLGVFTFGSFGISERRSGPASARYSIHATITGPTPLELVAVWTKYPGYVENAHAALDAHREALASGRAVLAGDLNSSVLFDRKHTPNHSDLVRRLQTDFDMVSAYHVHFGETQGAETRPTHVHNTRKTTFHIDYAFVPGTWAVEAVEVGAGQTWSGLSDHFPLVVDVADATTSQTEAA
jgi:hypothetical protein